jgi:hypothetical protein
VQKSLAAIQYQFSNDEISRIQIQRNSNFHHTPVTMAAPQVSSDLIWEIVRKFSRALPALSPGVSSVRAHD